MTTFKAIAALVAAVFVSACQPNHLTVRTVRCVQAPAHVVHSQPFCRPVQR